MSADLAGLIAKLEAATEPSVDLDREVLLACGWKNKVVSGWWHPPNNSALVWFTDIPEATSSIDAAVSLVPEGCRYGFSRRQERVVPQPRKFHGWVMPLDSCLADDEHEGDSDATPAIALCIAALRARTEVKDTE